MNDNSLPIALVEMTKYNKKGSFEYLYYHMQKALLYKLVDVLCHAFPIAQEL